VTSSVTLALRQRVLRPHQTIDELAGEDLPHIEPAYFAAYDGANVVGVATVDREAAPWSRSDALAWRLRQMATDEGWRGRGIGTAVLDAVIRHVAERGGGLLWCTARTPAVEFYRRSEFETRGEPWDDRVLGPHIVMQRVVLPA
jgi:GNAT superfamily N-acetyltransferase